jgi:tetratricopeptide (TPR) repeat protein
MHRRTAYVLSLLCVTFISGIPARAQAPGLIGGTVKDDKGQAIEGAKVTIQSIDTGRKLETKTDKRGGFMQIGLQPGEYKITVEKDKMLQAQTVRVGLGDRSTAEFVLIPTVTAGPSPEARAKFAEFQKTFATGVEASHANRWEDAIQEFTRALELQPQCAECYYNLATAYNAQKKFDQAAAAIAKASELSAATGTSSAADADGLFTEGAILWNAGKFAEAKQKFEAAAAANANHAEAHYRIGIIDVQEGNVTAASKEFETYLRLAPDGPNAAAAKEFLAQTKGK